MIRNILWDLDGTVFDTDQGIVECMKSTLRKMNEPVPDDATLKRYVGPPLLDIFMELYGGDRQKAEESCRIYRTIYDQYGFDYIFPFPGTLECIRELSKKGYHQFTATSRLVRTAKQILHKFELLELFDGIGAVPDTGYLSKEEIIKQVLDTYGLKKQETIMVGDRVYDMEGAYKNGICGVLAAYGYGTKEEFTQYKPNYIIESAGQLIELLNGEHSSERDSDNI